MEPDRIYHIYHKYEQKNSKIALIELKRRWISVLILLDGDDCRILQEECDQNYRNGRKRHIHIYDVALCKCRPAAWKRNEICTDASDGICDTKGLSSVLKRHIGGESC